MIVPYLRIILHAEIALQKELIVAISKDAHNKYSEK